MTIEEQKSRARHLAICVEYDGSCFHGWQMQANANSVQQTLAEAWQELTGENIIITGCSRTDAGVHAENHVSDFFTDIKIPIDKVPLAFNSCLPDGVAVKACTEVPLDFNSRFSACGKLYTYDFSNHMIRPARRRNFVAHVPGDLDYAAMCEAAAAFLGEHDFSAVHDVGTPVKSKVRTINRCELTRRGTDFRLWIAGDGFLYHMVRIITGTIIYVGQGKLQAAEIPELLLAKDRRKLGKTMPPQGLTLQSVIYRPQIFTESEDGYNLE